MPSFAYCSVSVTGTGAAPVRIQRSPEQSNRSSPGTCSMKLSMAGTIRAMLTFSRSRSCQASSGSKLRITTELMPR